MSLGFRRQVRVRDTHWGIVKIEMVFKAKKLEAVVNVDREKKRFKTRTLRSHNVSRSLEGKKTVEDQHKGQRRKVERRK